MNFRDYSQQYVNTPALIQEANEISRKVFQDSTIKDDMVTKILMKNKKSCIGLFEGSSADNSKRMVGYASCWPIKEETYEKLRLGEDESGGMSEADLTDDDILPDTEIDQSRVLFVPGIAVLDKDLPKGKERAAVLACIFLQHIRTTYRVVIDQNKPIKIFLVGFTQEGRNLTAKMADHLGMHTPAGDIRLYGELVPFYEATIFAADWDIKISKVEGRLFRTLFNIPATA